MDKKNRFVFNIGFNQANPDHVKVTDLLNQLGHVKAEYLTKAVLFYEENKIDAAPCVTRPDHETIEQIVRKILSEQKVDKKEAFFVPPKADNQAEEEKMVELEEPDMRGVLQVLDSFRDHHPF